MTYVKGESPWSEKTVADVEGRNLTEGDGNGRCCVGHHRGRNQQETS